MLRGWSCSPAVQAFFGMSFGCDVLCLPLATHISEHLGDPLDLTRPGVLEANEAKWLGDASKFKANGVISLDFQWFSMVFNGFRWISWRLGAQELLPALL